MMDGSLTLVGGLLLMSLASVLSSRKVYCLILICNIMVLFKSVPVELSLQQAFVPLVFTGLLSIAGASVFTKRNKQTNGRE